MKNLFNKKSILITGATGYFGKHCLKKILLGSNPEKVVIYSRDELKQYNMQKKYP